MLGNEHYMHVFVIALHCEAFDPYINVYRSTNNSCLPQAAYQTTSALIGYKYHTMPSIHEQQLVLAPGGYKYHTILYLEGLTRWQLYILQITILNSTQIIDFPSHVPYS